MSERSRRHGIRSISPAVVSVVVLAGIVGCGAPAPGSSTGAPSSVSADAAALHDAVRTGDFDEARRLIEEVGTPVDIGDRYDATALIMASARGQTELVQYLLDAGADVNHREVFFNSSAFNHAVFREQFEVVEILLAAGASQREQALQLAIRQELPELARAAVESGPLYVSAVDELRAYPDLAPEFRDLLKRAETLPDPDPPVYTRKRLERFEGLFETWDTGTSEDIRARVAVSGGGLRLTINDDPPVELAASANRGFFSADGAIGASFWGPLGTIEFLTLRRGAEDPVRMRHSVAEPVGAEAFEYDPDQARVAAAADGGNVHWPQFRGRNAGGVGDGAVIRSAWDLETGSGIRWQVEIPGLGNSSPIVWDDHVIVTTAVAEGIEQEVRIGLSGLGDPVDEDVEHVWRVMAFDKRSGKPLWNTEIGRAVPMTRRHFKASQANSTPVTDGERIVAVFPTAGIACLDLDGKVLWQHDLGGLNASSPNAPGAEWGFASSPVIYDGRVIVQIDTYDDPHIAAWDLKTGRRLWRTERDVPPSWATPTMLRASGGDELVVNGATIHGYDPTTGDELWSLVPNSQVVIATPVVGDDVVFVSAGYAPIKPIYALRPGARGQIEVEPGTEDQRLAWSHGRGGAYISTPLLYRGLLYVVHQNGRMVAYDADSGAPIYKTRFSKGGTFTSSPVAANGNLYLGTEEGWVYVIEAGPEYREIAVNEMGEPVIATPALSEGVLFLRTTRRVVAVGS